MAAADREQKHFTLTRAYSILTNVQSASAIAFSTFAIIHGSQIISANFGGETLANRSLLLTRPFYQDKGIETVVVLGSSIVHVVTGLAKAGVRAYWKQPANKTATTLLPYHRLVGYMQIPLLGFHYYLVRTLPIQKYGDSSFIDFSYIAWGLQNRPIFTYSLHTMLVMGGVYHAVSGIGFIYSRYFKKPKAVASVPQHSKSVEQQQNRAQSKRNQRVKRGVVAAVSFTLISGLVIIGRDTVKIPLRLDFEKMYSKLLCI
ncbi:hypothetical protein BY458DRAFT_504633 [Sporodiniella umbellata]|nr:hypothetical protein BY458DRAFT_504633 [Sporodiniella umbellata]